MKKSGQLKDPDSDNYTSPHQSESNPNNDEVHQVEEVVEEGMADNTIVNASWQNTNNSTMNSTIVAASMPSSVGQSIVTDDRAPSTINLDDMVDLLSKDQALISLVERGVRDIVSRKSVDTGAVASDDISRRVIERILTSQVVPETGAANRNSNPTQQPSVRRSVASRSRSRSPGHFYAGNPPPVKTVSFSSISTPHAYEDDEQQERRYQSPPASAISTSPQSSLPPSPMRRRRSYSPRRNRVSSANTNTTSGEITASGDSSISSNQQYTSSSRSNRNHPTMVRFSAMNPNPQLILDPDINGNTSSANSSSGQRVSFILNREVTFEDGTISRQSNSQNLSNSGSRRNSGLSSPSIEPALSPPISRSRSPQIQFKNAIETITEAAERLRREQGNDSVGGSGRRFRGSGTDSNRVVHFSAMLKKRDTLDHSNTAASSDTHRNYGHHGEDTSTQSHDATTTNPIVLPKASIQQQSSSRGLLRNDRDASPAEVTASRLREIVLSAERNNDRSLESSFRLLDPNASGYITADAFRHGLSRLGATLNENTNEDEKMDIDDGISESDCEELVNLFHSSKEGSVSLLDFYRFMGRKSPPPKAD